MAIKNIIKLKITVIILGNIEERLKIFVKNTKKIQNTKRNSCSISWWFYILLSFYNQRAGRRIEDQSECLEENTEKYITFSVTIKKELDKNKSIKYKIEFIDICRFMSSSLSNLVDNLSDRLHSVNCTDGKS